MTEIEGFQSLVQIIGDLTTTAIVLGLLFAERRAHSETRLQLEEARKEHLTDLRQMAYMRPTSVSLVDQYPHLNNKTPTG